MKGIALSFSVLLLAGAGCVWFQGDGENGGRYGEPDDAAFYVGSWSLVSVDTADAPPEDVSEINATLTLDAAGQLSAVICNSMSGGYSFEGGVLEAPELVSTLKFCTGVPGEVEAAFTQELATGFEVTGGGNVLVLRGDAGTDFRYERTVTMTGDDEDNEEDDDEGSEEDDDEGDEGEDRSVSGIVVSVNLDAIAFDGPAVVTVRTETEGNVEVNVPSFGINLCAAASSIADVYLLKAGDQVEVRGAVSEEGAIVPCESSEHYLRVVED